MPILYKIFKHFCLIFGKEISKFFVPEKKNNLKLYVKILNNVFN